MMNRGDSSRISRGMCKQSALIRQLQEQHYQQYMAQVYSQQAEAAVPECGKKTVSEDEQKARDDDSDVSDEEPGDDLPCEPYLSLSLKEII
uniref:MamL-1 domain-containing protein n=1 Tax=Heterorhabditis bacteriophora TaxID=37862 RepID=A0A1I7XMC2_HETBA